MTEQNVEEMIGKRMVIGFPGKTVPDYIREMIRNYHIGGIILFGRNIGTPEEILALTTDLQSEAKKAGHEHPLPICLDQENGVVRRLNEGATIFPGAMALGASGNPENAYDIGRATGKELKALGINWNLAPVLDVNNNPDNPVIGVRSFGESPEEVAELGKQMMKGMQDAGVITTLKHFPGHGDTAVDSHLDLPVISHSKERLDEVELLPFMKNIDAGADTIMSAHVYFPAIEQEEGLPATLSKKVITGLLREEMGFNGVVTTDCMEMNAISKGIGTEKGAVAASEAGVDLIMVSHTSSVQENAIKEMVHAVENDELNQVEMAESVDRIEKLKEKYLKWDDIPFERDSLDVVGSEEHAALAADVYRKSVTIVKNDGILPLQAADGSSVLVIHPDNGTTMQVEDKRYAHLSLGGAVQKYHTHTDVVSYARDATDGNIASIVEKAEGYDFVIVGTLTITEGSRQIKLVEGISDFKIPFVVIAMRSPYDLAYLPDIPAYINTYEFTYPALEVAAGAVFGKEQVQGKLPVTICGTR